MAPRKGNTDAWPMRFSVRLWSGSLDLAIARDESGWSWVVEFVRRYRPSPPYDSVRRHPPVVPAEVPMDREAYLAACDLWRRVSDQETFKDLDLVKRQGAPIGYPEKLPGRPQIALATALMREIQATEAAMGPQPGVKRGNSGIFVHAFRPYVPRMKVRFR